ncbi:MAG: hypothetical protein ACRDKW_15395 [Actinomycetota bacterium]
MGEHVDLEQGGAAARPVPDEQLRVVFDPRLADVWLQVFASELDLSDAAEYLACFLRMAYLRGYEDGLCEADRGSLFTSLGMAVPARRTPTPDRKERTR